MSKLVAFALLLFLVLSQASLWTPALLNQSGCSPSASIPPATHIQCQTNGSSFDIYGICRDGGVACISEHPELFQSVTNSLPEYLIPLYDLSCTQIQSSSLLGHLMVIYSQRQLLLLGFFPSSGSFYDCHTETWNEIATSSVKNIIIDLNPVTVSSTGLASVNISNIWQFTRGFISLSSQSPILLGNWSLPTAPWSLTELGKEWIFSASYSVTTTSSRSLIIPIVGGSNSINCQTSPLIKDRSTCSTLNRQLRSITPPTVSETSIETWSLSDSYWIVPLLEQCQQIYAYNLELLASTPYPALNFNAETRAANGQESYSCPNPLINQDLTQSWVILLFGIIVPSVSIPSPNTPSPLPPPEVDMTPAPSPSHPILPPEVDMTNSIIFLVCIILGVIIAVTLQGVGFMAIRNCCKKKLAMDAAKGEISVTRTSCLYTFCCLGSMRNFFINEEYNSGDAITMDDEPPKPVKKTNIDDEFKSPLLDDIRKVLEEDNSFDLSLHRVKEKLDDDIFFIPPKKNEKND